MHLSVAAGEIIYQLRSSLDHLVYGLTVREQGRPLDGTEFPIFVDRDALYRQDRRGAPARRSGVHKVRGIGPEGLALVESLQPFKAIERGTAPDQHILWVLHDLSNIDKHRTLHLTTTVLSIANLHVSTPSDADVRFSHTRESGPVADGDAIARFRVQAARPGQFQIHADISKDVSFVDLEYAGTPYTPVVPSLDLLGQQVARIVEAFRPLFAP